MKLNRISKINKIWYIIKKKIIKKKKKNLHPKEYNLEARNIHMEIMIYVNVKQTTHKQHIS